MALATLVVLYMPGHYVHDSTSFPTPLRVSRDGSQLRVGIYCLSTNSRGAAKKRTTKRECFALRDVDSLQALLPIWLKAAGGDFAA
ncbi:MAG TPA: hypothetical protein VN456_06825 [Desulfosporosinus sp.]|nr:hypothetical protein [Desulfosporosinus sp.]